MSNRTFRGVVKNGAIVLTDAVAPLEEGAEVLVMAIDRRRTQGDLLEVMRSEPHVPPEDVEELMRAIREGPNYRPSKRFLSEEPSPEREAS